MKEISAKSSKFKQLIEDYDFHIPNYQRGYSWDIENVQTLIDDILREDEGYYVGNLVLVSNKEDDNRLCDVVDGQQRLTTLFLTLLVLYKQYSVLYIAGERLNIINLRTIGRRIERKKEEILKLLTRQDPSDLEDGEEINVNKVIQHIILHLLPGDKKIFDACVKHAIGDDNLTHKNRKMVKSYLHILEMFDVKKELEDEFNEIVVKNEKEVQKRFHDYVENFDKQYSKVLNAIVLPIILDSRVDAFSIFSSMNGKGQSLTEIDLLKAEYLRLTHKENDEQANKQATEQWDRLIETADPNNNVSRAGEINRFLQTTYDAFYNDSSSTLTKKAMLPRYEKLLKDNQRLIDELLQYAQLYGMIIHHYHYMNDIKEQPPFSLKLQKKLFQMQALDMSTSFPMLLLTLRSLKEQHLSEDDVIKIYDELINLFVRRNVTKTPKASNLRSKLLAVTVELRKLEQENGYYTADDVIEKLHQIKVLNQDISDEIFRLALKKPIYDNTKVVRYMLIAMVRNDDRYNKRFNKENRDTLDEKTEENPKNYAWTIEHIFPQNDKLPNGWDKMIINNGKKVTNKIERQQLHQERKDLLGNLTLTGYNSVMKDKSFVEKKEKISKDFPLNQSIFDLTKDHPTEWTTDDIVKRTDMMAEELVKLFPWKK